MDVLSTNELIKSNYNNILVYSKKCLIILSHSLSDFFRVGLDQYIILTTDISKAYLHCLKNLTSDDILRELGLYFLEISNSLYTLQLQCPNQRKVNLIYITFNLFYITFYHIALY